MADRRDVDPYLSDTAMPELFCPTCGKEMLVIKEPIYEGFTRVGEQMKCAVCGHLFDAPAEAAPTKPKIPAIFTEDDLPPKPSLFAEGENRVICRYCRNYLVNPFKQWCGRHNKEVEATDTCKEFAAKGDTGIPAGEKTQTGMSVSHSEIQIAPLMSVDISRRNLPHWHCEGAIYWVTFRLADSLPQSKIDQLAEEKDAWLRLRPKPWGDEQWREYNDRFGDRVDAWLDAGHGSCALKQPDVRDVVKDCLMKFDGDRVHVHAAVIMPNHVHVVMEPLGAHALTVMLKGIKGASARFANQCLGLSGSFWMDESYDHIVRSEKEYRHFIQYIKENPAKAKLGTGHYWLYISGDTGILACVDEG